MRSLESAILGDLAQRVLAFLVMVLVVYLAYSELRACGRCLFSFRQRQLERSPGAVALLTRPFTLVITLLSSIDSVMTVLIARDLLSQAGSEAGALVALPAVMLGIGLIVGQGLYGLLGARVGLRRLIARGALVMLLCACFTGATVAIGSFWLYCVAKLAMAIPFGMLYALGYSMPRLAGVDEELRSEAAGGVKRTDTSAAVLGTVLGGYAAQVLGSAWVYALVAMACIPVMLMAYNLLPRDMAPLEVLAQPERKDGRILDFVRTPAALGIALLIMLPATLASGYTSFLFPLFSIALGLSKSDVNNVYALGQLVVYICIDSIDRVEALYGKRTVAPAAIALLGVVFLLFSVNTTLVWSIAVVAVVGVLCKSSDGWKAMWLAAAGEAGVSNGRATAAMFAARSLTLIAQPFIMGALLGATDSVAVIVIGAVCVLCDALFALQSRSRRAAAAQAS